ncbi:3',5'-cyclic AMP phosphodiesterase CpdA [Micromonospora phaseoli]|uniref:3',5'-cyclic AMP phosphodiesterase CpdA n=2 Tax=Micromonospora phaseoli TaxID=1144548 RepID=A0A1H6YV77_9ACTN|nr:3',5'-cyclic AMP phosphodiesterase CpdA [Micromonospora phaseoli]
MRHHDGTASRWCSIPTRQSRPPPILPGPPPGTPRTATGDLATAGGSAYDRRMTAQGGGALLAISDLHVGHPANRPVVEGLRPDSPQDWLLVAGDVGDTVADIEWALSTLKRRFDTVVWVPGNHELWTPPSDPVQLRGVDRYRHLVALCRQLGVLTPEDPYPIWRGPGGPVLVAPLFLLYDYSWRPAGLDTPEAALAEAYRTGIVCTDEFLLHPDPYPSRSAWCAQRVAVTGQRLVERDDGLPTVLVNHWPLVREPTRVLRYPIFAQWCGTDATADWHRRFHAAAVVYGHLHIPRTTRYDGVRFEEVSVGYPREWRPRATSPTWRRILPAG